jgi:4-carboxymuconolactone decarboxylase
MTSGAEARASVAPLEAGLRNLIRIAGAIAGSPEGQMRAVMSEAIDEVDPVAVEEIILQSYLFAGFPRALNAARAWRAASGRPAPLDDIETADPDVWREKGSRRAPSCTEILTRSFGGTSGSCTRRSTSG